MNEQEFETYLQTWEPQLAAMNSQLIAWRKQNIDYSDPAWMTKISPIFFDNGKNWGVTYNVFTEEIADVYLTCTPQQCEKMRQVLSKYGGVLSFLWISLPLERITSTEDLPLFRRLLAFESIEDQGSDTRDAMMRLGEIYTRGEQAGIDIVPCIEEIQKLSSPVDKYGWGSMQTVFGMGLRRSPAKERMPRRTKSTQKPK